MDFAAIHWLIFARASATNSEKLNHSDENTRKLIENIQISYRVFNTNHGWQISLEHNTDFKQTCKNDYATPKLIITQIY